MTRSLESVLGEHRPRAHTVGALRVDHQGRLLPPVMLAHSAIQQDFRRFSEASIIPPPRPPPPNFKRPNMKPQRRSSIHPIPGTTWPPQMIIAAPAQAQPLPPPPPQQPPQVVVVGSNLPKMSNMARSTPQLDDTDNRERERGRERDKSPHIRNTKDGLIAQVRGSFLPFLSLFSFPYGSKSLIVLFC